MDRPLKHFVYRVDYPSEHLHPVMKACAVRVIQFADTVVNSYAPWTKWSLARMREARKGDAVDSEVMLRLTAMDATPTARLIAIAMERT